MFKVLVIIFLCKINSMYGYCPGYELLSPCYCHTSAKPMDKCYTNRTESSYECQTPVITCAGDQPLNLRQTFIRVNNSISDERHKHFEWFYLSNTAITGLDANTLSGLRFTNIYIRQCVHLKTINRLAFRDTAQYVRHMWINATNLSDDIKDKRNAFKALSSLRELRTLDVMACGFTSIPTKAFNTYSTLRHISFNNYNNRQLLTKINAKAFHELSDLRRIDLRNNRISRINSHAFAFHTDANHTLRIHLENNYLDSDSFGVGAFMGTGARRVILYLGGYNECNPYLKRLDKSVFEPFLTQNGRNIVELYGCPIECNGEALWMEGNGRKRSLLDRRIRHLKCIPNMILTKIKFNNNNHNPIANISKSEAKLDKNRIKNQNNRHNNKSQKIFLLKNSRNMKKQSKRKSRNDSKKKKTKTQTKMTLKKRLGLEM